MKDNNNTNSIGKQSNHKNKFIRSIEMTELLALIFAAIALILMLVGISYGIFSRAVLNNPILWVNDLASYLMIYLVFLSAPWVLKEKGHVTVDLLTSNLKNKTKKYNIIFASIISIIACVMYFYFSLQITFEYFVNKTVVIENIAWPKYALYLPLVIGNLGLIGRFIIIIYDEIKVKELTN